MAQQITEDTLGNYQKFLAGEIEIDAFDTETQQLILSGRFEASLPKATESVIPEEVPEPNTTSTVPSLEAEKPFDIHTKYKAKSDELNTILQREQSHLRRMKTDPEYAKNWLKEQGINLAIPDTPSKDVDIYSEEHQLALTKRLDTLENTLKTEAARKHQEQEQKAQLAEIQSLMDQSPSLKLERPFEEINTQYARAWEAAQGDLEKFKDEAFAREQAAKGVRLPEGQDFEKYLKLAKIVHSKRELGYPTLRAAYRDSEFFESLSTPTPDIGSVDSSQNNTIILDSPSSPSPGFREGTQGRTAEGFERFLSSHPDEAAIMRNPQLKAEWEAWMNWAGMM